MMEKGKPETAMREMEERELLEAVGRSGEPLAVFLETPLCGTCKLARRMMDVAALLLPEGYALVSGNVNRLPGLVDRYRIASVPALLVFDADRARQPRVHYALTSVERVLSYMRSVNSL